MFYKEIQSVLKIENREFALPCVTLYGRCALSVEGHRGIMFFSSEEVRFRIKGGVLSVSGRELSLTETGDKEAVVSGYVSRVEYV